MTAFLNSSAIFYCSASERAVFWIVDGTYSTNISIVQREIHTSISRKFDGDTMARLIVLASERNNNTRLYCGEFTSQLLSDEVELKVQGMHFCFMSVRSQDEL